MLAPAAAGSVLELWVAVHWLGCFCFFILGKVFAFAFRQAATRCAAVCFRLDPDGPDEAQQFASHCSDDFSLVFSCGCQPRVALVQPVLCFPGYLFGLFRSTLLAVCATRSEWREAL